MPQTLELARPETQLAPAQAQVTRLSDEAWETVQPILQEYDPPRRLGRKRIDQRQALDAIVYRLRSGCRWNHLPKEYPDDSSVHRTFQRWVGLGIFDRIWAVVQEACEDLGGCDWEWQAADTSMGKARMGGASLARTRLTVPSPA